MKQKVLFALIALMSFMTSWAATEPALQIPETVQGEENQFSFYLSENPVVIGGEQAPAIPTVTMSLKVFDEQDAEYTNFEVVGVYTFADGKLTKVETIDNEKVNNYYIQVSYDDGEIAFVPFKTIKRVEPEIVWNRESYEASVYGQEPSRYGLYQKYLKKMPWSYVWDLDLNSDEPQPKCWYADKDQDTNGDGVANYDDCKLQFEQFAATAKKGEDKGYAYTWDAIYNDFPDNQLLNDFPTIGYAHNDDSKVDVRFVRFVDGEWVDPINNGRGWKKTLEKDDYAVAAWNEFLLDPEPAGSGMEWVGLVAGQTRINLGNVPEEFELKNGDVYYNDNGTPTYATDILQEYPEGHPIYNIRIELSPADEFASQEDLVAAAEQIIYKDWTMDENSDIYAGDEKYPGITVKAETGDGEKFDIDVNVYDPELNEYDVKVKYFTDAELKKEVDEMIHAGTYYVQVYVPAEEQGNNEPAYAPLGKAKQFTITKNTLEVVLQQIYMPYGSSLPELKPVWIVKKAAEDMTRTQDIVVENLGDIIKGTGWAAGEEAETVEPNQVRNYTTSSQPKAYVGRTYKENGEVDFPGYEDYIATTNTSSANIVTTKGTLTVDITNKDLTKVFGFVDPEYTFTATTQGNVDVNKDDDVANDVTVTREDMGTAEGEAVGFHDLTVTFDKTHYDLVLTVNGEEKDKAQLEITQFDLAKDNIEGYGKGNPEYKEKFIIEMPKVTYTGENLWPDPKIYFQHDTKLGRVEVSNFDKWKPTGPRERYITDDYTYVNGGAAWDYAADGPDKPKVKGSYSGQLKNVKRDATTGAVVEESSSIKVDAVEGGSFIGSKTQTYTIQPAPLAVKVKDYVDEDAKAYMTPEFAYELETINPSDVVAADAAQKTTLLAGVSNAIAAIEGGFSGYTQGDKPSKYVITVSEAAQADPTVIMAMPNYALDFANNGSIEIKEIELVLKAKDQNINYPTPVEGKYSAPKANTTVDENTVEITGALPAGVELSKLVELEQTSTKVGENPGALVLKAKEGADDAIKFTVAPGNLNIAPLNKIYLSYENMAQALEDHKGVKVNVYLSNRKIKADQWYAMVLPFEFNVPEFSNKLYYGVVDLLDKENASDDVRFKLTVGTVPANTPFLFKLAKAMTADQLAEICFDGVEIGNGDFAYNDAAKAPFSADAAGHKFVGLYPTVEVSGANKFGKVRMEANEWFISTADGGFYSGAGNANQKMLQTDAFISFPTAEAGAKARFFIEDADGTVTAIEGIDAEVPAEGNADAAREGWYTVNGVKLNAQPTQKGLYIFNGKKVYVK